MKKYILPVLRFILFTALLVTVLLGLGRLLEYKNSRYFKEPLYEIGQVDVLLAGSSHVHNELYPMMLWKDFGITSYNAASAGEKIGVTYHVLRELMDVAKPKVVVVDSFLITSDKEGGVNMDGGQLHESMDFMKLGPNKIELAKMAAESENLSPVAFLSDIYAYHFRWKELEQRDFAYTYSRELGCSALAGIYRCNPPGKYEYETDMSLRDSEGYRYLEKIMELCREKNCRFLLVNVPFENQTKRRQAKENTYMELVREYGFDTMNYRDYEAEMGLDYSTDFRDPSHTNILGSKKLTAVLGKYLKEKYELKDYRGEAEYFERAYAGYSDALCDKALECDSPEGFLMCAYDYEALTPVLFYRDEENLKHSSMLSDLLGCMEVDCRGFEELPEELGEAGDDIDIICALYDGNGRLKASSRWEKYEAGYIAEEH